VTKIHSADVVDLEIIGTTYFSMIFKIQEFSLFSHLGTLGKALALP
jgi:hypothetical protein